MRQRTALISGVRSNLAEFGIIAAKGRAHFADLFEMVFDAGEERLPPLARQTLGLIIACKKLVGQVRAGEDLEPPRTGLHLSIPDNRRGGSRPLRG